MKNVVKADQVIVNILSGLLIVLWVYAAGNKLMDLRTFEQQLRLQYLPDGWAPILLWLLPGAELVTAVLLIVPATVRMGLLLSAALLFVFSIYILLILNGLYKDIPCSCGGVFQHLSWPKHLIFNLTVLAFNIYCMVFHLKERRLEENKL